MLCQKALWYRGIYPVLAQIAICRELWIFVLFFGSKIFVCAILYAFSIAARSIFSPCRKSALTEPPFNLFWTLALILAKLRKCKISCLVGFIEWKTSVYFCPLFCTFQPPLTLLTNSALWYCRGLFKRVSRGLKPLPRSFKRPFTSLADFTNHRQSKRTHQRA